MFSFWASILLFLSLSLQQPAHVESAATVITTPAGLDKNRYLRCHKIVQRLYAFLDTDGDGVVEPDEVKRSDLSALGLTNQDRTHLIEGCYFISEMTTEDINVYFQRCARMEHYLAHFNKLDGQDIFERFMDPASDSLMEQMLIPKSDRVQLRRRLFKSLLQADSSNIQQRSKALRVGKNLAPSISNIRHHSLTVRLSSVEQASGYKVQYCEVDDGKSNEQPTIDVCGFAWSAVYPTPGVHIVKLYGLRPRRKYEIRVRSFFCDGASVVGQTIRVTTLKKIKKKSTSGGAGSKQQQQNYQSPSSMTAHLPNPAIKRISASRDTILLSWDGGCRVDANVIVATKKKDHVGEEREVCLASLDGTPSESSSPVSSSGDDNSGGGSGGGGNRGTNNESLSYRQPVPIMWEVKYDRDEGLAWKGHWQTAGCVDARRVDNMNDDPFSCFIGGLKEGRRYKFAVFGKISDGSEEIVSKISRHMTSCDDDDDCYGEKICSNSFKCVRPQFSKSTAMWLVFFLFIVCIIGYVVVIMKRAGIIGPDDVDVMQSIDEKHDKMTAKYEGLVKDMNSKKMVVDNLTQEKIFKWKKRDPKKEKQVRDLFPFEKFQYKFFLEIGGTTFLSDRYLGGGGFGRVFLLRPVIRSERSMMLKSSSSFSSSFSSSTAIKVEGSYSTYRSTNSDHSSCGPLYKYTNGSCMAIKYMEVGTIAKEVDMIQQHLTYHCNVSRPRFWSKDGFQHGNHVHTAPNNCFLIMPYQPLGSLDMFIPLTRDRRKPLPPRVVRRIAHQALKGLHHLHKHGYIHLDIKPGNIMLSEEGILKLVDFGEMEYIAESDEGVDGITHNNWDDGRGTVMFCAPELGTPFGGGQESGTYTYDDPEGKRFYYCERAGHFDNCGFNRKVDIYALGISLLQMARGYQVLVDKDDMGNGVEGHHEDRLRCCEIMGTYVRRTGGMDEEKLMKDIPKEYRLNGKLDFFEFLKKMLCPVKKRFSARALLREREDRTWLRISEPRRGGGGGLASASAVFKEEMMEEKKSASSAVASAASAASAAAASASAIPSLGARQTSARKYNKKQLLSKQSSEDYRLNSEFRENTMDSPNDSPGEMYQADATLEELCSFLVEYDETVPRVNELNRTRPSSDGDEQRLCFVEQALRLFPCKESPIVMPLKSSSQGNTGTKWEEVEKTRTMLEKYLKLRKARELALLHRQQDVLVTKISSFFSAAWGVNDDAAEREKKESLELIHLFVQYCRRIQVRHVASLDIRELIELLYMYYSYKIPIKKRKSVKKKVTQFQERLHKEFCIVWDRNPVTGMPTNPNGKTASMQGERIQGDVEMSALWCRDCKCGWMWVRTSDLDTTGKKRNSLKTTSSLAELRSGGRGSAYGRLRNSSQVDGGGEIDNVNEIVEEQTSLDNMVWKRMFVSMDTNGSMQCYGSILDCITDMNEVSCCWLLLLLLLWLLLLLLLLLFSFHLESSFVCR